MTKYNKNRIKIVEIVISDRTKVGNIRINGKEPEPHEQKTIDFLSKIKNFR